MNLRRTSSAAVVLAASGLGALGSNAGYYFAVAALPCIHARAMWGPARLGVPRATPILFYFALLPLLIMWGILETLEGNGIPALKSTLMMIAPWVLIAAGYDFARSPQAERSALYLVLACVALAGALSYAGTGFVSSSALMSLAAALLILQTRRAQLIVCVVLLLASILLTEGGSRIAFVLVALQGAALLVAERSVPRKLAYGVIALMALGATVTLISSNELFASKLEAGLDELLPNEFDVNSYGGASNLRGYEAALVLNWATQADPATLLLGSGPSSYIDSGVALHEGDETTQLNMFHNALLTYLVKFGAVGILLVLSSFALLTVGLVRVAGLIEGAKVALMLVVASIVAMGSFSYGWIGFFFAIGVFLSAQWRGRAPL